MGFSFKRLIIIILIAVVFTLAFNNYIKDEPIYEKKININEIERVEIHISQAHNARPSGLIKFRTYVYLKNGEIISDFNHHSRNNIKEIENHYQKYISWLDLVRINSQIYVFENYENNEISPRYYSKNDKFDEYEVISNFIYSLKSKVKLTNKKVDSINVNSNEQIRFIMATPHFFSPNWDPTITIRIIYLNKESDSHIVLLDSNTISFFKEVQSSGIPLEMISFKFVNYSNFKKFYEDNQEPEKIKLVSDRENIIKLFSHESMSLEGSLLNEKNKKLTYELEEIEFCKLWWYKFIRKCTF
jgi:hypothetical protein